ncbi:MAG TPA: site-specific integrase [Gaiellaceae bacterium]
MRELYVTLLDHGSSCVQSAEPRARRSGDEAAHGWSWLDEPRLRFRRPSALDARRGRTDHPRSREGQELPLDTARPARRAIPPLVPQRVRRHRVDAPRLRGGTRPDEPHAGRPGAHRRLRRRPPRCHRSLGRAFATDPAEGHVGRPRLLELGRGTRPHRDLTGRAHQATTRRETRPPLLPADARPRLLTIAKHPRDRLALFCLLLLGVRRGELAGIQVRDFDAHRCSLRVYGKGRKERVLPLRGPVLAELGLFLSTDLPHARRPPEPDDFLLYPTKKVYDGRGAEGQQLLAVRAYPKKRPSPQAVHRWWYRQLQAAGLVGRNVTHGLNMHLARHTFATELRRVAGIDAASQALGHADLNTTLGIYGHRDQTDLETAMDAYASWLEQQRENDIVPPEADR